jgi:hypothetical protein
MAEELEKLHVDALAEVVAKLRAHPAVKALVPEQVFNGTIAEELAQTTGDEPWTRCVLVLPGKNYGLREGLQLLCQRDALVIMRAENQQMLDYLAVAVVRCLNSAVFPKLSAEPCVHTSSQDSQDGPGVPPIYRERRDRFALTCNQPEVEADEVKAVTPPTKAVLVPTPSPARARVKTPKSEGGD